eukprot:m.117143 g.117143  ORF g.117143 m.117143 type:complete len:108 (-) comp21676_c0_seq1:83-406(-)
MPLVQVDTVETGKRGESPRPTTWHLPIRFGLALSVYTVCPPFGTPAPVPPTLSEGGHPREFVGSWVPAAVVNQSLNNKVKQLQSDPQSHSCRGPQNEWLWHLCDPGE